MRVRLVFSTLVLSVAFGSPLYAGQSAAALTELSIEDLANVEVTSASRRLRKLSESANAVFVITREDIRRSGATTLPDVLRMAPGVHVAHIDGNRWAVGVRGYNDRFSNKLLVLVDGRSVYTPIFSGVFWETQDTLLEDVERIEVIRGPGATMWGANAVNGVINIITRSPTQTEGVVVSGGAGSNERFGEVRYGAGLGTLGSFRVFAKNSARDGFRLANGADANDDGSMMRAGGRVDLFPAAHDTVTIISEAYGADFGVLTQAPQAAGFPVPTRRADVSGSGRFVLGTWKHALSPSSSVALQSSFDHTDISDVPARDRQNTLDVDFQHEFSAGPRHDYVWGAAYRRSVDDVAGSYSFTLDPPRQQLRLFSAFAQTDINVIADHLRLTLGTRLEHHTLSGLKTLPNARLLWTRGSQSAWVAASRAVRTPSRIETGMRVVLKELPAGALFPGSPMGEVVSSGFRVTNTETVIAYESGYRVRPARSLSVDVAAFYNGYDHLLARRAESPYVATSPLRLIVPFALANTMQGTSYGAELAADWHAAERVRLSGSMSERRFSLEQSSVWTLALMLPGSNPTRLASVRAFVTLPRRFEVAPAVYYSSAMSSGLDALTTFDLSTIWKASPHFDVSIVGRDLLNAYREQFTGSIDGGVATAVPRSVMLRSTLRF
jgi:iron complex outermembrane recepter protein